MGYVFIVLFRTARQGHYCIGYNNFIFTSKGVILDTTANGSDKSIVIQLFDFDN
jgi:hypothetical protein